MPEELPTLIIPDVHLRMDGLRGILSAWNGRGPVIFLGDFFDDFDDTPEMNSRMAEMLRDEILPNPNHTVLMGNHDLHYHPLCPPSLRCSGFASDKLEAIGRIMSTEDFRKFKWSYAASGVLFTHAGLHPHFVPAFQEASAEGLSLFINERCELAISSMNPTEPLLRAGYSRYGNQPHGGVVWMDVREYAHIDGLSQVFGHTPCRKPVRLGKTDEPSLCLDTNLMHIGLRREPHKGFGVEELAVEEVLGGGFPCTTKGAQLEKPSGKSERRPKTRGVGK